MIKQLRGTPTIKQRTSVHGAVTTQDGAVQAGTVPGIAETSRERREQKRRETGKDGEVDKKREIMPIFSIRTSAAHLQLVKRRNGEAVPLNVMKPYRGAEVQLQSFLTSALDGSGQFHAPAAFTLGKEPRYTLNRTPGGPRAGRCVLEKRKISLPAENLTPYSPAATKSPHCPNSHPTSVRTSPTLTFRNSVIQPHQADLSYALSVYHHHHQLLV